MNPNELALGVRRPGAEEEIQEGEMLPPELMGGMPMGDPMAGAKTQVVEKVMPLDQYEAQQAQMMQPPPPMPGQPMGIGQEPMIGSEPLPPEMMNDPRMMRR